MKRQRGVHYIKESTWLHRLDPRTKLVALVLLSMAAMATEEPLPLLLIFGTVLITAALSHMTRPFLGSLRLLMPVLLCILIIDAFFPRAAWGTVYYSAEFWIFHPVLSTGGLLFSAAMCLRLLAVGGFSFLFIMTTAFSDFVRSLRASGLPNTLAFSLGYALRSVSALTEDIGNIMDAQRSRALEFDRGNLVKNRHKILALAVPATVSVLSRARQVSEAMQCRGFGAAAHPTCYQVQGGGWEDVALVGCVLLGAAVSFLL
ncbi:energy-coupling factor transporter transmembrane protein EcfT [Methanofollis aquaemaris]|uniref:Energy-coupling factor transporter transmembrane protein EcfT n=1 Tax=Methanofollis aquaemaris TaxID=126734 RepID=A0A8A3S3X1_9EURY|nr:energy-coupling factor transporter transmembrane component T [Methanofollis aquaemaris]QSZ66569.1 energy-coupling factor transporter transmembrane protein EcfT [Methanofollis aquaemaris]